RPDTFDTLFENLKQKGISEEKIREAVSQLSIELVLTAHPTEITRRTLIHKHVQINRCLDKLEHDDLPDAERRKIHQRLMQLIAQAWYTDEIRKERPTPLDEAKWGYAVVENSLWQGVPEFLREFDSRLKESLNTSLPIDATPIRFSSWMGGDRDGNPFVTASITRKAMLLSRWKAADLFLRDINELISELSMSECSADILALVGDVSEPYRVLLKQLRKQLLNTLEYLDARLKGQNATPVDIIDSNQQLWTPLHLCYESLKANGMTIIADGLLLDTLRRIRCFGIHLVQLDIRQESTRHADAVAEITRYLGLGDYAQWSEADKQAFLVKELTSKRPLLPLNWQPSEETAEVIETCRAIAEQPAGALASYVISMARQPSDVLA
ncbi:MAG: phosphoenolpyruvate carboxylase, partial [Plesiomonas shigelloides]